MIEMSETQEDIIEIEVQAQDQDNDDLEYCYLVDREVIQDWTPSQTYSWHTEREDLRLKTITVEVRDEYEAIDSIDRNVFLFRKTPLPE